MNHIETEHSALPDGSSIDDRSVRQAYEQDG